MDWSQIRRFIVGLAGRTCPEALDSSAKSTKDTTSPTPKTESALTANAPTAFSGKVIKDLMLKDKLTIYCADCGKSIEHRDTSLLRANHMGHEVLLIIRATLRNG